MLGGTKRSMWRHLKRRSLPFGCRRNCTRSFGRSEKFCWRPASELDRDVLGQYFLARERWLRADKLASQAIRDKDENLAQKWASTQNTYFRQVRQCAESMGLSVTARCRIVIPTPLQNAGKAGPEDGTDEFTRQLRARQAAALEAAECPP